MTKVAIVILNWNGRHFLEKYLPSVVKNSNTIKDCEVVLVDNNSSDDSVEFMKSHFSELRLICFDKNHGFAGGYKKALKLIEAEYFVLLNSDVEVTPKWIEPVIQLFESDASVGAAMPKIKSFTSKEYFEYSGAAGGYIDKYGFPFCRGRILSNIEADTGQYDDEREVFWATGACLFVRSNVYFEAGGLDDDFFAHMEEIDLCWRIKKCGYKIMMTPKSVIYHVGGGTLPNNTPRKLFYNYRNSLYLLFKNLPQGKLIPVLFTRLCLDCMSAAIYLLRFSFAFFFTVLKAHIAFYGSLPSLIRKRRDILRKTKPNHVGCIYPKSIVFSFFVKRKKIFTQLHF